MPQTPGHKLRSHLGVQLVNGWGVGALVLTETLVLTKLPRRADSGGLQFWHLLRRADFRARQSSQNPRTGDPANNSLPSSLSVAVH